MYFNCRHLVANSAIGFFLPFPNNILNNILFTELFLSLILYSSLYVWLPPPNKMTVTAALYSFPEAMTSRLLCLP